MKRYFKKVVFFIVILLSISLLISCGASKNNGKENNTKENVSENEKNEENTEKAVEEEEVDEDQEAAKAMEDFKNGIPFEPEGLPGDIKVGGNNLKISFLKLDDPIMCDTFECPGIGYHDGKVYTMAKTKIYAFNFDGSTLKPDTTFGKDGVLETNEEGKYFSVSPDGILYVTDAFGDYHAYDKTGADINSGSADNAFVIGKDNQGGTFFMKDMPKIVTADANGGITESPFLEMDLESGNFPFKTIEFVFVEGDKVYIAGTRPDPNNAEESFYSVGVFQKDGTQIFLFENGSGVGKCCNIGGYYPIKDGSMIMDSNCRNLLFLDHQGNLIRELKVSDGTGMDYPWPSGLANGTDGKMFFVATQEREDKSGTECLIYLLDGIGY
ncbi:MAG: hypothetical protein Q4Q07_06865 [Tissierellia bacterium]|nr:hypothetical protein [Tissierellia bacterium]